MRSKVFLLSRLFTFFWSFVRPPHASSFQRALELGINFFDTADMYSLGASEQVLGSALRHYARRDEVVVASKVYFPMGKKPNQGGLSSKHILESIDNTLKRIGTDYLDLYQIHRWDYNTPIEETMQALHDVVRSGKVHDLVLERS